MHILRTDVQLRTFLTWTVNRDEWSTSRPGHFTLGKELQYPLNERLGGSQSLSGRFGEEKNPFARAGIPFLDRAAYSLLTTQNVLPGLPKSQWDNAVATSSLFLYCACYLEMLFRSSSACRLK